MNQRKQPESYKEFVDLLAQLIREDEPETKEELDERIRDMGREPAQLVAEMRVRIEQAVNQSPLNWRNSARQKINDEKAKIAQQQPKPKRSRDENMAAIASIQQKLGPGIAMHFRNLDLSKLTDEELESMTADFERLEAYHKERGK